MHANHFDALTRGVVAGTPRRRVLRSAAAGALAALGAALLGPGASLAGKPCQSVADCPPGQICNGGQCDRCPASHGSTLCGATCCPDFPFVCCNDHCCDSRFPDVCPCPA